MPLTTLIFDVDGTLAETEEVHRQAFNETFKAWGLNWYWDQPLYATLLKVTGGKERMRHYMTQFDPPMLVAGLTDADVAALHGHKTQRYMELILSGSVKLRPGVETLIRGARDHGIRLAIATTTSIPNVKALISATLGEVAMGWFDAVAAGDIVANKKPAPDVYKKVLQDLGVAPEECLAIEDSANGLQSALGAGIPTLITRSVYTDGQDFSGAQVVLKNLKTKLPRRHGRADDPAALADFLDGCDCCLT